MSETAETSRVSPVWWTFGAALAVRLLVAVHVLANPQLSMNPNSRGYLLLAAHLLHGSFPSLFRTPVYPLFVALTGGVVSPAATIVVQLLLDAGTGVLIFELAQRLTGSRRAGLVAGLLWAFCPVAIALSCSIMTETLCVHLLCWALWLALSRPALAGAVGEGLMWSAATLCRPICLPLPLLGTLPPFTGRANWRRRAVVLAIYSAVILGWSARNWVAFGRFELSSVVAVNQYVYGTSLVAMLERSSLAAYARLQVLDPRTAEAERKRMEREFVEEAGAPASFNLWKTVNDPAQIQHFSTAARARLRGHFVDGLIIRVVNVFQALRPIPPWEATWFPGTVVDFLRWLLVPCALGWALWRPRWRALALLTLTWIGYTLGGGWRFRLLAEPLATLTLAVFLVYAPWNRVWRRSMRALPTNREPMPSR